MAGELAKAVCQVMKAVRAIPETGYNAHGKYNYASDADLLGQIQPAMAEAGLALIPRGVRSSTVLHGESKAGNAKWRTDLVVTYDLVHISGESATVEAAGCGLDGEDKGAYKAMTGCLKYALRQLFLVPTGEDAERNARDRDDRPRDDRPRDRDSRDEARSNREASPTRSEWDPAVWTAALAAKGGLTLDECVWWAVSKHRLKTHPKDLSDDDRAKALAFFCGEQGIEQVRGDVFEVRGELQRAFFTKWSVEFPEPRKKDGVSEEDRERAIANSEDNRRRVMRRWYGVESVKQVSIRDALKGDYCIGWLREVRQNDFATAVDEVLGSADDSPSFPTREPPEGQRTTEPLDRGHSFSRSSGAGIGRDPAVEQTRGPGARNGYAVATDDPSHPDHIPF